MNTKTNTRTQPLVEQAALEIEAVQKSFDALEVRLRRALAIEYLLNQADSKSPFNLAEILGEMIDDLDGYRAMLEDEQALEDNFLDSVLVAFCDGEK